MIDADLASDASVAAAFETFRQRLGGAIASVIHLAAYFNFASEDHPLYQAVNVDGTRRLLRCWVSGSRQERASVVWFEVNLSTPFAAATFG